MLSIHPWLVNTALVRENAKSLGREQELKEGKWKGMALIEPEEVS